LETLRINVGIDVVRAGNYDIIVYLQNENGSHAGYVCLLDQNLINGSQIITLDFDTIKISGNGPWTIAWIQLRDSETGKVLEEHINSYTTTTVTSNALFENYGVTFNNINSDSGNDSDLDGKYNSLNIELGVNVTTNGYYTFSALLLDNAGNTIGWYTQEFYLTTVDTTISLQIEGQVFLEGEYNGPYLSIFINHRIHETHGH
jgi:hypothetical protein